MTPIGINGDGLIVRSKRQDQTLCRHCVDTVQLIHAKPAIESPPTRPWPPTPAAVRRPACPRLAVAPAHDAANQDTTVPGLPAAHAPPSPVPPPYRQASQSLPSCVQLPPSTPCRLATSPFRTRKNVLHAYTTQYRPAASARQVGLRSLFTLDPAYNCIRLVAVMPAAIQTTGWFHTRSA
jgi:hypothetical protein